MSLRKKVIVVVTVVFLFSFVVAAIGSKGENEAKQIPSPTPEVKSETVVVSPTQSLNPNFSLAKVSVVIDGDTIEIEGGQRVRLIGIDTPETVDPNRPAGCFGKEASDFTKSQLLSTEVKLEKDVSETDRFGRLLRYIWLNDSLFNEVLVKEGFAQSSTYPPDVKYQARLSAAQVEARSAGKGLWGTACQTPTSNPFTQLPTITTTETKITQPSDSSCLYSCTGPDKDCSDFSTHSQAQNFFNCCGFSASYDPMRLDKATGTGNGLACESLP
jgi:micrococcal nuclease